MYNAIAGFSLGAVVGAFIIYTVAYRKIKAVRQEILTKSK